MIEFQALGPVDVRKDGSPPTGRSLHRKNLALLAYLGRSPNRARRRDQIVGVLWPEKDDQTARHSLRQAIRDLKADLGEAILVTASDEVCLASDAVVFDFDRFEQLRESGRWSEAAPLVRGEFMEGFSVPGASAFEDWLSGERSAWKRRSLEVLFAAAHDQLASGDVAAAADLGSAALAVDPHSDAAVQVVMRCSAIEGNPVGALEIFESFRRRLADLALEPHQMTCSLAESVKLERQWKLPSALKRADEPTRRTPLVGRSPELAMAMKRWTESRTSNVARLVLIEGDQGMGKTRLAEEIAARARLDGAHTAWVRSVEADEHVMWSGVAGLFTGGLLDAPGLAAADADDLSAVAAVVPEIRQRFAITPRPDPPALDLAVPRVLHAACEEQPVALVFDDAHYLDVRFLELLHVLERDLQSSPFFLLLTSSPQHPRPEIEELRARIGREITGDSVHVGPLGDVDLETLGRFFVPRYDDEQLVRLTRRIALDSGRIPLLAVELLHAVAIGLTLEDATPDWPQPGRTLDQTVPGELPDAVIGAIRAAYWRTPENARKVLLAVAAAEGRASRPGIHSATAVPDAVLDETLDWLEWERWLVGERRGYTYAARIVRDVIVHDMLTPGQAERYREVMADSTSR